MAVAPQWRCSGMTCAIYCRLSKEDSAPSNAGYRVQESESIQNQRAMLLEYAVRQEWDVYAIYCDEDYSGADRNRPDFNRMLEDAKNRKFQVILCKTQSRFTRDMELVEKYIHGLFPLWGVRFVAVVDNVDTDIRGNKKARQINGLINEWYLEELSENIRAVFAQKRKQGQYIGSFPAYGYRKDPTDHNRLLIDEESAGIVREIFRFYQNGIGTQRIAALLNEQKLPNPTRYKQLQGQTYGNGSGDAGGLWTHTTVARILRNEVYTGTMVQGIKRKASFKSKKLLQVPQKNWIRVPNTHEPIVTEELFCAVQRRLNANTRADGSGKANLLAGKIRCMDCGSAMQRTTATYKGEARSWMVCKQYANTRSSPLCTRHSVRLEKLTAAVEERIRTHTAQWYTAPDIQKLQHEDDSERRIVRLEREMAALKVQEARLSHALQTLYLDKVDGTITAEQFPEMNLSLLKEKQGIQERIRRFEKELRSAEKTPETDSVLEKRVQDLLKLNPMPQEVVDLLVDYVAVGERNSVTGEQEIHIHWRV